jgi:hypothetical protein
VVKVQWDSLYVRLLDPRTGQLLREHVRQNAAGIGSKKRTGRKGHHFARPNYCGEPVGPEPTSVRSARPSIASKAG